MTYQERLSKRLEKEAYQNEILRVLVGSNLYGINTESSDLDWIGVYIPSPESYVGIGSPKQYRKNWVNDDGVKNEIVLYPLSEFVSLLSKNNPNLLEVLFAPENFVYKCLGPGRQIKDRVDLFLSKKRIRDAFFGYAQSQKKLLRRKRAHLNEKDQDEVRTIRKLGANLIRVLFEGKELLETGKLSFPLENAPDLKNIRSGLWNVSAVLQYSETLEKQVEAAFVSSTVQEEADLARIHHLLAEAHLSFWGFRGSEYARNLLNVVFEKEVSCSCH